MFLYHLVLVGLEIKCDSATRGMLNCAIIYLTKANPTCGTKGKLEVNLLIQ